MTLPENISQCWQMNGYHVYKAGPCFEKLVYALTYKAQLDERGITWHSQDKPMMPKEFYQ